MADKNTFNVTDLMLKVSGKKLLIDGKGLPEDKADVEAKCGQNTAHLVVDPSDLKKLKISMLEALTELEKI